MLQPGSEVIVRIDKPVAGGRMIARHGGQVLLVYGGIPGERVRARVDRVGSGVAYGSVAEVLEADPDRRPAFGDWACGGNVYAHVAYERQRALKAQVIADGFARIARLDLPAPVAVTGSAERGYRMRARLHARGPRLGFFREGTHDLCDAGATGQLLGATAELLVRLEEALRALGVRGVAAVELAENVPASERALHFDLDRQPDHSRLAEVGRLTGVTGVSCSRIDQPRTLVLSGEPYVSDDLPIGERQARLRRHVRAFFQANRFLLADLVSRVVAHSPRGTIADLYAGVGLFSVSLAAAGWSSIVAVEADRVAAADLRANALPYGDAIDLRATPVERCLAQARSRPDAAIVDPPRTGLSREALAGLARLGPPVIIYVSCDIATLARDIRALGATGYRLEHIEAFDLFPNTAHVETLVVVKR